MEDILKIIEILGEFSKAIRLFAEMRNISIWIDYEVPYLSTIGALIYLVKNYKTQYSLSLNLLARYISTPTRRHRNGIKYMSLFYSKDSSPDPTGHADVGYSSNPHKSRSQTYNVFTCGDTVICWRYTKQFIVATLSNDAEIIAIHEASREYAWLRFMIHLIQEKCGVKYDNLSTILYRDNSAYIAHLKGGYINGDRTKHILPEFFYIHELQKNDDINVQQIRSTDNVIDLFTKSSQIATFRKMLHKIEMQRSRMFSLEDLIRAASLLMSIHHRNLISVVGYCVEGTNIGIIYEYMPNRSLDIHLSDRNPTPLTWEERLQIALDAAQGTT
ncbi:hypothetical protein P3L10_007738 [Capsicum annuum]